MDWYMKTGIVDVGGLSLDIDTVTERKIKVYENIRERFVQYTMVWR